MIINMKTWYSGEVTAWLVLFNGCLTKIHIKIAGLLLGRKLLPPTPIAIRIWLIRGETAALFNFQADEEEWKGIFKILNGHVKRFLIYFSYHFAALFSGAGDDVYGCLAQICSMLRPSGNNEIGINNFNLIYPYGCQNHNVIFICAHCSVASILLIII